MHQRFSGAPMSPRWADQTIPNSGRTQTDHRRLWSYFRFRYVAMFWNEGDSNDWGRKSSANFTLLNFCKIKRGWWNVRWSQFYKFG